MTGSRFKSCRRFSIGAVSGRSYADERIVRVQNLLNAKLAKNRYRPLRLRAVERRKIIASVQCLHAHSQNFPDSFQFFGLVQTERIRTVYGRSAVFVGSYDVHSFLSQIVRNFVLQYSGWFFNLEHSRFRSHEIRVRQIQEKPPSRIYSCRHVPKKSLILGIRTVSK